jgi:rSAM/selenodomain-associated transferase 2
MAGLSVIIPALNEAAAISKTLEALSRIPELELVVVDGGSTDGTDDLARRYANVHRSPPGRARQMNVGAEQTKGELLLFLHADSILSKEAIVAMKKALEDPEIVGGGFCLGIDSSRRALGLIAAAANWRTRLTRIPYGDQGIFVRRSVFEQVGGYPEQPLMEDLEFSRRLKRAGRVVILSETVRTSSRRWDREGILWTTLRNQILVLLYWMGVPPARLARWYRPVR